MASSMAQIRKVRAAKRGSPAPTQVVATTCALSRISAVALSSSFIACTPFPPRYASCLVLLHLPAPCRQAPEATDIAANAHPMTTVFRCGARGPSAQRRGCKPGGWPPPLPMKAQFSSSLELLGFAGRPYWGRRRALVPSHSLPLPWDDCLGCLRFAHLLAGLSEQHKYFFCQC